MEFHSFDNMPTFLEDTPGEKKTRVGESTDLQYGVSSMRGWRWDMEDADLAETNLYAISVQQDGSTNRIELPGHSLFAVLDGHGARFQGTFSADYSSLNLVRVLCKQSQFAKYALALQDMKGKQFRDRAEKDAYMSKNLLPHLEIAFKQAFVTLDFEIAVAVVDKPVEEAAFPPQHTRLVTSAEDSPKETPLEAMNPLEKDNSGTTACCVLVTPDLLLCANAGDCRAILYMQPNADDGNVVLPLCFEHKPDNPEEERRILKAGGKVERGRVDGELGMSRALGDFEFKHWPTVIANHNIESSMDSNEVDFMHPGDQKVSPIPDFKWHPRDLNADKFLVVACDGIWDVCSNLECAQLVETIFSKGESDLGWICEKILHSCLMKGSKDNMTALVVKFPAQEVGTGGGTPKKRKN